MDRTKFYEEIVNYSQKAGFVFLLPGEVMQDPQRLSFGKLALISAATGAAWGLLGTLSTGYMEKTSRNQLVEELVSMRGECEFVGVRMNTGHVELRLVIDGDRLSGESIAGKLFLTHKKAYEFRKYAARIIPSLFRGKMSVYAQAVLVLSSHGKATEFWENFADKCKHRDGWRNVITYPWLADLETCELRTFSYGFGHFQNREVAKLKAGVFGSGVA